MGVSVSDIPNAQRFSGFADLYDAHRPSAPAQLGSLLTRYANVSDGTATVVDLGSGTGLSSRWATQWAGSVIGVEPSDDMRAQAERQPKQNLAYRSGVASDTGLSSASADVVIAVQAMHWMEPGPTLTEVARVLRPGGVFATIDADWPPVSGVASAENAWAVVHRRIRVFEARLAAGAGGEKLRAPINDDDPALVDENLADPHRNRLMPGQARSWSKREHLGNIERSGLFVYWRELVFIEPAAGGADRFVALLRSQGSYQALVREGLTDDEIGAIAFERTVREAFDSAPSLVSLSFNWRVRLGVRPAG